MSDLRTLERELAVLRVDRARAGSHEAPRAAFVRGLVAGLAISTVLLLLAGAATYLVALFTPIPGG